MASRKSTFQSAEFSRNFSMAGIDEINKMDPEKRRQIGGMSSNASTNIFSDANPKQYESYSLDIADQIKRPVTGSMDIVYDHHGIYIGSGMVIDFLESGVRIIQLEQFTEGKTWKKVSNKRKFSRTEVCQRAFSFFIGENSFGDYNSTQNNCEHFVNFCITGERVSRQVETTIEIAELLYKCTLSAIGSFLHEDSD